MIIPAYNLPFIMFVGGESEQLRFNLHTVAGDDFDAYGCTVDFSIVNYSNKTSAPIFTKTATLEDGPDGYLSVAVVDFDPNDTKNIHGRYIYQLTIKNSTSMVEIPGQGIIDIVRNIHPDFITG